MHQTFSQRSVGVTSEAETNVGLTFNQLKFKSLFADFLLTPSHLVSVETEFPYSNLADLSG